MKRGSKRWEHVRVERGIYQQSNGKYAVCVMIEGKPRLRTVSSSLASKDVEVEESLENEDARARASRPRAGRSTASSASRRTFTGDADNPLSIVIEEVALRVAGNGGGASA